GALADRVIEDRGIGGEPGHREGIDIALQGAVVQQLAGDGVEPEALTKVVQVAGWLHRVVLQKARSGREGCARVRPWRQIRDSSTGAMARRHGGGVCGMLPRTAEPARAARSARARSRARGAYRS